MNPVTLVNGIVSAMPSASAIGTSLMTGAIGTVILSGLQSVGGQNALDPLHLIFKPNTTTATAATATAPATVTSTPAPTMAAATFAALPLASQQAVLAAGTHIS